MSAKLVQRRLIMGAIAILVAPFLSAFLALSSAQGASSPDPTASFGSISAPLIGQSVGFDVSFKNADLSATGYGPYLDLRMPLGADGDDGLTFTGATYLGAPVTNVQLVADSGGCVTHPYALQASGAALQICGLDVGQSYVVLRLPFGSFTPGQPAATVHVTTSLSNKADAGTPLTIGAQGGFQFGADPLNNPTTDPSITGAFVTTTVDPTIMRVTKSYGGPENETATGQNYPRTYTISVSIAPGQTVTNLLISDTLPGTLQYVSTAATTPNSNPVSTPSTVTPGGTLSREIDSVTGTGGTDATMTFTFFVPRVDAGAGAVLDAATGAFNTSIDSASASGSWTPVDVRDATAPVSAGPATHTLTDKSIAIQKSVSIATDTGPAGVSPGDTLQWTIALQVSDYFALNNVVVDDLLGDGSRVDGNAPTLQVSGNQFTTAGLMNEPYYTYGAVDGSGRTPISFHLSDELSWRGLGGRLVGGCINPGSGSVPPNCAGYNDGATTATITFKSVVQQKYVNGITEVVEGDTLVNEAAATATVLNTGTFASTGNTIGDGSAGVATAGASASISIDRGSLTKTIYAVNGSTSFSSPVHVSPGDRVTYRLQQVFPTSRTDGFRMVDFLPLPVFYAAGLTAFDQVSNATAPAAGHAQWGPADTFHLKSGAPVPSLKTNLTANSIEFDYGDYALYPPAPSTADILFSVTVSTDPFADGLLLTNQARSETSNSVGTIATADAIIQLTLDQPVLTITKGVVGSDDTKVTYTPATVGPVAFDTPAAPPSATCPAWSGGSITSAGLATHPINSDAANVDASDYVRFAITIENTGHANAYQVQLKDTIPAGFAIPAGGADVCVARGDGTAIATANIVGGTGLFDKGIQLSDAGGPLGAGTSAGVANGSGTNVAIVTYTLRAVSSVTPNQTITNTASLLDFTNDPGAASHLASAQTDDATVTTAVPAALKEMTATSLANTAGSAVAVGEIVTYRLTVTLPEGSTPGATIVDNLPAGLAFKDCTLITASGALSTTLPGGFADACHAATAPGGNPSVAVGARTMSWNLGDVVNTDTDNATPETVQITYTVVAVNSADNARGQTLHNSVVVSWSGGSLPAVAAPDVHVVEPHMTVTKSAALDPGDPADAGDVVTYTLTVTNPNDANGSDGFDVKLTDVVPTGMHLDTLSLRQISGPAVNLNAADPNVGATWDTFPQGATATLEFKATIGNSVVPATVFTNTADLTYTSLPGDVTTAQSAYSAASTERTGSTGDPGGALNTYSDSDSVDVTVPKASVTKQMTGGNLPDTADPAVAVGEVVGYQLVLTIPEGSEPSTTLVDTLPAGLGFKGCVSVVSSDPVNLTTSLGAFAAACSPDVAPAGNPQVSGGGHTVTFDLGTITNANRDNTTAETVTINYQAVVLDVAANTRGVSLTNSAVISWTGGTSAVGSAPAIHVVEPILTIGKTRAPISGDAGDTITYTITIANPVDANSARGYEAAWTDTIPSGMTYVPASLQTTGGTAPDSVNASGQTLSAAWATYDPAETTTLTYQVTLDASVQPGQVLTNDAQVVWSSLPGDVTATQSLFNAVAVERTGNTAGAGGAANTYKATDDVDVTVIQPKPVKTIVSSSEPGTSDPYATIGEIVRFRVAVQIPEGTLPSASVVDQLPAGLTYLKDDTTKVAFVSNDAGITSTAFGPDLALSVTGDTTWAGHPTFVLPAGQIGGGSFADGTDVVFDLGTLTNDDRDDDGEMIVVEFNAVVDNVAGNTIGKSLDNTASISVGGSSLATSDPRPVVVAEPVVTFTKVLTTTPTDAGDAIVYRITVSNGSGASVSPAYDLAVTDAIDSHIDISSILVAGPGTWTDNSNAGTRSIDVTFDDIEPGAAPNTITITGTVHNDASAGLRIPNTANAVWTSLPGLKGTQANATGSKTTGDPGTENGERTGIGGSPNLYLAASGPATTLAEPSIAKLGPSPTTATIGATTTFDLVVTMPEGTTTSFSVVDHLPAGLEAVGAPSLVTTAAGSGGRLTADYAGSGSLSVTGSTPPVGTGGGDWTIEFGTVSLDPDGNATNDSFLVQVTARVANVIGNQSGTPLTNRASIIFTNPQSGPKTVDAPAPASVTVLEPVLKLVKSVDKPSPRFGDTVTYTLTISHDAASNSDAFDVDLTDTLPTGLTYVGGSLLNTGGLAPTSTSVVGNDISIHFNSLPLSPTPTSTFTYQATVGDSTQVHLKDPLVNSAIATWTSLSGADANERTGANGVGAGLNNYAFKTTVTVTVSGIDLDVSKDDLQPSATRAANLTYTLTYHNTGNQTATGVVLTETVPVGSTYTGAGWTCPSGNGAGKTCTMAIGNVNGGGAASTKAFRVTVVDPIPSGLTSIVNNASIADDGSKNVDPTPANNATTDTDTVPEADLSLTKSVNDATPDRNQALVFTLTVHNAGPSNATSVRVTDLLPAGLTFVSSSGPGTYAAGTGLWNIGTVNNGANAVLTINATAASSTPTTNVAQIIRSDQEDPDSVPNNGITTEDDYAKVDITPNVADLGVTKAEDKTLPDVGTDVTFTITASNAGPNDATNAKVTDALPAHLTFKSQSATQGSYDSGTGIWTIGTLTNGSTVTLTLVATVNHFGPTTNTATVSGDPFDLNAANDSASASFDQLVDLVVGKTVDNASANVGQTVTFTVTVANSGPDTASGVVIHDPLPAGLTWSSDAPSQGSYDHTNGDWTVGSLAPSGNASLTLRATVTGHGTLTNTASVKAVDEPQSSTANDSASASVTPPQADLAVTKSVAAARPNPGDSDSFTITVTNNGPDTATNVTLSDVLPVGLGYTDATPSKGSYASGTGTWTVGTLAMGASATLTVDVAVNVAGDYTNTASVSHSDQYDPVAANDSASVQLWTRVADIAIAKSVDDPTPNVGSTVNFTITATNNGPDAASQLVVTDLLGADFLFISATPIQGSYDSGSGDWTIGNLGVGADATLHVRARVLNSGHLTNTATLKSLLQRDQNAANNAASASVDVPLAADLSLTKTIDNPTPDINTNVTFTITVDNAGPNNATGVKIRDVLPNGLTYVSSAATTGAYDSATGVWTVGTVNTDDYKTLTLVAKLTREANLTNTAEVSASDQFDPDSTPANGVEGEDDTASAGLVPTSADLAITKTVDEPNPDLGTDVTFTITATNAGPDDATGVSVSDRLPAGLTYKSSTPSVGSYDDTSGVWTIGPLAKGAIATLTVVATVTSPGPITNTATISGNQDDPDLTNNHATSDTDQLVDLVVTKSVANPAINVGSDATFTVTVRNAGPGTAHHVVITDKLPAGLTYVSDTPDQGTYDPITGDWTVGALARNASVHLTLQARVAAGTPITNHASVKSLDEPQSSTANDTASATVTPPNADLAVVKTVSEFRPNVGDPDTFTITVTNNGPDNATGVTIFDMLPAGLGYTSYTASQGSYDSATGLWTVGNIPNGATATLTVRVTVTAPDDYTNTAAVTESDQFDPVGANNSSATSLSTRVADIGVTKTAGNPTPAVGTNVTFIVTATNNGPDDATQLVIRDALPATLTFVSAAPTVGTFDPATGDWSVGSLANGASQSIQITARVVGSGSITNTAAVHALLQRDQVPENDSASAAIDVPPAADLSVSKTPDNADPNLNEPVTFTIRVTNHGPNDTAGVHVADLLPAGLTYVSSTPSAGTYDSASGDWAVGGLNVGASATLAITATVGVEGPITNTCEVTASSLPDPDSTPGNGAAGEDDQASAVLNSRGVADLSLAKRLTANGGRVGTQAVYAITVHNAGPDAATGVIVRDQLPAGLTFVSASGGTYDAHTGAWTVGNLGVGASATLTLTTRIGAAGAISNTAEVAASDQRDPNSTPGNGGVGENDESVAGLTAKLATMPPTLTSLFSTDTLPNSPASWLLATMLLAAMLMGSMVYRSRSRRRRPIE